jgi:hypothetical protein
MEMEFGLGHRLDESPSRCRRHHIVLHRADRTMG